MKGETTTMRGLCDKGGGGKINQHLSPAQQMAARIHNVQQIASSWSDDEDIPPDNLSTARVHLHGP